MKQRFLTDDGIDAGARAADLHDVAFDTRTRSCSPTSLRQLFRARDPGRRQLYSGDVGAVAMREVARRTAKTSAEIDDARSFSDTGRSASASFALNPP